MTMNPWVLVLAGMAVGFVLALAIAYRYTEKEIMKAWAAAKETVQEELEQERYERDFPGMYGEDDWICALCGCTNDHACKGGCYWVYPNLCSACAEKLAGSKSERRMHPISSGYGDTLIIECDQQLDNVSMQKLEESIRNMVEHAAVVGPGPGFLFLGQGIRLAGVIRRNEHPQKEGNQDE